MVYGTGAIIQSDIRPMALVIGLFLCPVVNIENYWSKTRLGGGCVWTAKIYRSIFIRCMAE